MADSNKSIENRIAKILSAIKNGFYTSCRGAALDFNVLIRRLQRRHKGLGSLFDRPAIDKALNEAEEQAVVRYIEALDRINMNKCQTSHSGRCC